MVYGLLYKDLVVVFIGREGMIYRYVNTIT